RRQPGVRARSPSQERPRPSVHARAADRAASRRQQCDVATESDVRATEPRIAACRRRRYGGLPFARAREPLDLTCDALLLQTAKPVDKERAFEVIHLVLKAAREQTGGFDRVLLPFTVQSLQNCARRAGPRALETQHP